MSHVLMYGVPSVQPSPAVPSFGDTPSVSYRNRIQRCRSSSELRSKMQLSAQGVARGRQAAEIVDTVIR